MISKKTVTWECISRQWNNIIVNMARTDCPQHMTLSIAYHCIQGRLETRLCWKIAHGLATACSEREKPRTAKADNRKNQGSDYYECTNNYIYLLIISWKYEGMRVHTGTWIQHILARAIYAKNGGSKALHEANSHQIWWMFGNEMLLLVACKLQEHRKVRGITYT